MKKNIIQSLIETLILTAFSVITIIGISMIIIILAS